MLPISLPVFSFDLLPVFDVDRDLSFNNSTALPGGEFDRGSSLQRIPDFLEDSGILVDGVARLDVHISRQNGSQFGANALVSLRYL